MTNPSEGRKEGVLFLAWDSQANTIKFGEAEDAIPVSIRISKSNGASPELNYVKRRKDFWRWAANLWID